MARRNRSLEGTRHIAEGFCFRFVVSFDLEPVAAAHKSFDFGPVERHTPSAYPAVLPNIGRAKKARIVKEIPCSFFSTFMQIPNSLLYSSSTLNVLPFT